MRNGLDKAVIIDTAAIFGMEVFTASRPVY